jgi:predicted nucleotidyltransferase component of viral defense system
MKTITNQERELILDLTGEGIIRLPAGVLEKDILITEVLQYLSLTNNFDIELIFCGGTSLSKAYGIIDRMSEDLDFKSILPSGLSRSSRRKLLEKFREKLTFDIESLGFEVPKEQIVV